MRTLTPAASAALAGPCAIVQLVYLAFSPTPVALNSSNWDLAWYHNFSRASTARYWNASGVLASAAVDVPRMDYDPATLAHRGLLIEAAASNLLTYSDQVDNAAWVNIGAPTVTANSTAAPDGATTADTLTDSSVVAFQGKTQVITVPNDSAAWVYSQHVKKTTGGTSATFAINLQLSLGGSPLASQIRFNTDTGAALQSGAASTVLVRDCGAYWRFSASITNNSTGNTQFNVSTYPASSAFGGGLADVVTATGSAVVWGAQLEAGTLPTSYIPTTSAAATRAADLGAVTFKGAYGLGSVGSVTDQAGQVQGLSFELAGSAQTSIALALDDADVVQGTAVTLRTAVIETGNYTIVDAPVDWLGKLDTMSIAEDGEHAAIRVTAESKAVDLLRGTVKFYNDADQQAINPADRSFAYVVDQIDKPVAWPAASYFQR